MREHNNRSEHPRKVFNSALHALRWLDRGIYPVPLEAGTKRPKGNGKWTELRVTPASIDKHFKEGDNLGGLWGEPSAWAIDVDLDTPEAQAAARHFLPETLIYGRGQAPGSHYIYHCKNAQTQKYHTKDTGMLVEIRSTGSQSVLPGSTHPSGDRYRIDHDIEIQPINWLTLRDLVRKIAAVSIAAYYYPEEGSRHDYVHALTGALLHGKWPDGDVRQFMEAVRDAASETDEEVKDRDGTIENTIKSYREGKNVQGLPTLATFMPTLSLQNFRRYLGIGEFIPDNDETPPDSIAAIPVGEIDPRHLTVPGLVGEIMKWAGRRSIVQQPLFDLAIGLMGTALATRNRYRIAGFKTPLQPYVMCVARTAGGKDHVQTSIYELAIKLGLKTNCFDTCQSYHSMMDLVATTRLGVWLWEECALYLKASARSPASPEAAILAHTIKLYGKAAGHMPGIPARKNPIPPLEHPFFLVLGTTQPEILLEAITAASFAGGLVNRFLLFDAGENMSRSNEQRSDVFPSAIERKFKEIENVKIPEGEFIDVEYADQVAFDTFKDFQAHQFFEQDKPERGSEMWGRAHQNALIIAGIVAVGVDPVRPLITREIALWATNFSKWSVERWIVRVDQSSSRSYTEQHSKDVERIINQVRRWKFEVKDERERRLIERGLCPKSFLARKCRHIKIRELNEILTSLIDARLIGSSVVEERDVLWPSRG